MCLQETGETERRCWPYGRSITHRTLIGCMHSKEKRKIAVTSGETSCHVEVHRVVAVIFFCLSLGTFLFFLLVFYELFHPLLGTNNLALMMLITGRNDAHYWLHESETRRDSGSKLRALFIQNGLKASEIKHCDIKNL